MKQVAKAPVGTFTAIFVLMAANVVLANRECPGRVPVLLRSKTPAWCAAVIKEKECVKAYTQKPKSGPRECVWKSSQQKCVVGNVCATECAKINAFGEGIMTLGKPGDCHLGSNMAAGSSCNVKCDVSKGFSAGVGTYKCAGRGAPAFTSLKCTILSTAVTKTISAASTTTTLATPTVAPMTYTTSTMIPTTTASAVITTTSTTPITVTVKTSVSTTIPTPASITITSITSSTSATVLGAMTVKRVRSGIMGMQQKIAITPVISRLNSHTVDSTTTKAGNSKIFATDGDHVNIKAKTTTSTNALSSSTTQQTTPATTNSAMLNTIRNFLKGNLFMVFTVAGAVVVGLLCTTAIFICVVGTICQTNELNGATSDTPDSGADITADVVSEASSSFDINVDVVLSVAATRYSSSSIQQHTPVPQEFFDDESYSAVQYDEPVSLHDSLKTSTSRSTLSRDKDSHPFSRYLRAGKDVAI